MYLFHTSISVAGDWEIDQEKCVSKAKGERKVSVP
jgi:hypothetical protein